MDITGGSETKKTPTEYSDFIIIGGGSAGSVLANRLTASGRFSVTLIEAGRNSHVLSTIPISFAKFIDNPNVNWLYSSEPSVISIALRYSVAQLLLSSINIQYII